MMKVIIRGGKPVIPIRKTIPKNANLAKELPKFVETLSYCTPGVLSCQVGKGKTYGVVHGVLPWAIERGLRILYISSRVANNDQLKAEIIEVTGQRDILDKLTAAGIREKEDFGSIYVLSYHKAYQYMIHKPEQLKDFDIVIIDEVQAFLEDSTFVGFTGTFLKAIPDIFAGAIRLYLSATPDDILPLLAEAEAPHTITVLHMPRDYSYVKPHFFSKKIEIQKAINKDKSGKKWYIFMRYIATGKKFAEGLDCDCCFLNSEERTSNPEKWTEVISNKSFPEKVAIITGVVDVGVGFIDEMLENVVIFSLSPTTIIQVLGRKRRRNNENINLYICCPSADAMRHRLQENIAIREALSTFWSHRAAFVHQYILAPDKYDFRSLMHLKKDASMEPNALALVFYENEARVIEKCLKYAKENKDPYCFDRYVCRWLGIKIPPRSESWLDPEISGKGKSAFFEFINSHCGINMTEADFAEFMREFPYKCMAAFGKGSNDRFDRPWKATKFNNKIKELNLPYRLVENKNDEIYRIEVNSVADCSKEE